MPTVACLAPAAALGVLHRLLIEPMVRSSVCYLDALGERAEVGAAIGTTVDLDPLACRSGDPPDHLRSDACWG